MQNFFTDIKCKNPLLNHNGKILESFLMLKLWNIEFRNARFYSLFVQGHFFGNATQTNAVFFGNI